MRKLDLPKTLSSLQTLIKSMTQTTEDAHEVLTTSNKQITETLANLRAASQNIKQISDNAKDHPSALFFGQPPPPLDLNKI